MPAAAADEAQLPGGDVENRVRAELGHRVVGWTELRTGTNNRLFRLDLEDGPPLLAKFYVRDRWDRLGTEFPVLAFLADRGVAGVPRPYLRSDAFLYGVYSFEPGERKAPSELTAKDVLAAAAFAAELHSFGPDEAGGALDPANAACFSFSDHIGLIELRLRSFEAFAADPAGYAEVRAVARDIDLPATVARLVARATAGLGHDELARALPRASWRLTTYDFGPHNMLVREDGITVVDLEGAGWDDPARMVMGFVSHAGSDGLSPAAAEAFLGAYADARGLSAAEVARFERVGMLFDVEWATVYASVLTPEAVAAKRFGTADFDLSSHLVNCIARMRERLARAERGDGYRFPAGAGR
ncbi:MAG TPA: phosphotransferase [Chloroflexota bacterium]|nr:phosphotransferase [Chloroflexota bacterium]